MPLPKPAHQPCFTDEQLAVARRRAAKRTAPVRTVPRTRLTLALAEQPDASHEVIAARCGVDRDTVYKWRRRWATAGGSLEDAPRSGGLAPFPLKPTCSWWASPANGPATSPSHRPHPRRPPPRSRRAATPGTFRWRGSP